MTKQKLKFKVEGGLQKLSELYSRTDNDVSAAATYWHNPAALMEALEVAPAREIRISHGYKKLADTMDKIDFGKWEGTFSRAPEDAGEIFEKTAFNSLMHAVGGVDPALRAGDYGDAFNQSVTITSVAVVVVVVTVTVVSGYQKDAPTPRTPVPGAPKFSQMAAYAQSVAEQVGWFSQ